MLQKLIQHGESDLLVFDERLVDLLKLDDQTPFRISTDGTSLLIVPEDEVRRAHFQTALAGAVAAYGPGFEGLPDTSESQE